MSKNLNNISLIHKVNTRLIKSLLILRGIDITELAKDLGISIQYLSYILHGKRKGKRIRKKIADLLGMPYETLWLDKEEK
jgi:transcriptional regulator with XRE-family HTH domain